MNAHEARKKAWWHFFRVSGVYVRMHVCLEEEEEVPFSVLMPI